SLSLFLAKPLLERAREETERLSRIEMASAMRFSDRGDGVPRFHSTTILAVRHQNRVAIGGDGQVTLGNVVMKSDAHKIRKLQNGRVLIGFAGASADAFALLERFEAKLKDFQGSVPRAATELAK